MNKEEIIQELLIWAQSSKGLSNLWGDGLIEKVEYCVYKENRSAEWIKEELKILDKIED